MGIPGILKEIGKGERIALSKFAVEHLERTRRPLRIAIDAAIWQFQHQAGQGGKNPALRTLFYRLLRLLALPIHPVFVYDGKDKPLTKRNVSVKRYGNRLENEMFKQLARAFHFPNHTAPGEAEAECALLQRRGIVDAVMSQDVDAIMFGSTITLRDWSKEATKGSGAATHVNVLRLSQIRESTALDTDGMILVALLSGGDYDTEGVAGFGPSLACEIAKAGFGKDLLELVVKNDFPGLQDWRERLQYELETNESGYFKTKHKTIKIPDEFPDRAILDYYTNPAVSTEEDLLRLQEKWLSTWDQDIDVPALRKYVAETLDWQYRGGASKLTRCLAPALLAHRLRRGIPGASNLSADNIKERRRHFINDGMPELRVEVLPAEVVGLDFSSEEDRPVNADEGGDDDDALELTEVSACRQEEPERASVPQIPLRKRKSPPWDAFVPEKMWIPETIVKLGFPAAVEEWHQRQRDTMADPKKFASRKCVNAKSSSGSKNGGMEAGALDRFVTISKPGLQGGRQTAKCAQRQPLRPQVNSLPGQNSQALSENGPRIAQNTGSPRLLPGQKRSQPKTGISSEKESQKLPTTQSDLHSGQPTDSLTLSPHNAGKSAGNSISISSSPLNPKTAVRFLRDNETRDSAPSSSASGSQITSTITIRGRPKQRIAGEAMPSERSSTSAFPPIESFFNSPKHAAALKPSRVAKESRSKVNEKQDIPREMPTAPEAKNPSSKLSIVSRESLPGTWKAVEICDEVILSLRARPRVSYVDLTGD